MTAVIVQSGTHINGPLTLRFFTNPEGIVYRITSAQVQKEVMCCIHAAHMLHHCCTHAASIPVSRFLHVSHTAREYSHILSAWLVTCGFNVTRADNWRPLVT